MGAKTKIDWCDSTYNPVTGCLRECEYCYARGIAERFEGVWDGDGNHKMSYLKSGIPKEVIGTEFGGLGLKYRVGNSKMKEPKLINAPYPYGFHPTLHRHRLESGLKRYKKPRNIFVCSMADLFGDWVPESWIEEVFNACAAAPQHRYMFLTKNPSRYIELALPESDNFWFGTTITTKDAPCYFSEKRNFFVSIEPILGAFGMMETVHPPKWVIVGSMTGPLAKKYPVKREWIEDIADACKQRNIPLFMKESLRGLMGGDLVQEYPWRE